MRYFPIKVFYSMNQNCLLLSLCPSGTASPLRKKKKKKMNGLKSYWNSLWPLATSYIEYIILDPLAKKIAFHTPVLPCGDPKLSHASQGGENHIHPFSTSDLSLHLPLLQLLVHCLLQATFWILVLPWLKSFRLSTFQKVKYNCKNFPNWISTYISNILPNHTRHSWVKPHHAPVL